MDNCNFIGILPDGLMHHENSFKDIFRDMSSNERFSIENTQYSYETKQSHFNTAEQYNKEQRARFNVTSYPIENIMDYYICTNFINTKYLELFNCSFYIIKVFDFLVKISNYLINAEKVKKDLSNKKKKSYQKYNIYKQSFDSYLAIVNEINAGIEDLLKDPYCHLLEHDYITLMDSLRTKFSYSQVPEDSAVVINNFFQNISLKKFTEEEIIGNEKLLYTFINLDTSVKTALVIFRDKLQNQCSYYITSNLFLNNPIKKTMFVVNICTYKKFNFINSGLYRTELYILENSVPGELEKLEVKKNFYKEMEDLFNHISERIQEIIYQDLKFLTPNSPINDYINAFKDQFGTEKNGCIKKIIELIKEPRAEEFLSQIVNKDKTYMDSILSGIYNPWTGDKAELEKQNHDIALTFLLTEFHKLHYGTEHPLFSCTHYTNLFRLFSYTNNPYSRCSEHVSKILKGKHIPSKFYEENYASLLVA